MNNEDIKNLMGWIQVIYKELQITRTTTHDMQAKINMLPEIREATQRGTQDSSDAERKIDETRQQLENRINNLDSMMQEIRSSVRDIQQKVDRIK